MQGAAQYYGGGPAYYPGQTFVGPTPGQIGGWDTQLNYADQVFGGQQAPQFGQATGALGSALAGNTTLGSMANTLSPVSSNALSTSFANPFGTAGGLDARGAIQQQLSGTPDYSGLQGAIDAANKPLLRQFEQEFIPGLNQRASFLGNSSGAIKDLNRVLPELGERMSLNALSLTEGERQRALSSRENAANLVAQGGLSTQTNALGLGGLAGQLASGQSDAQLRAVGQFPALAQAGAIPGQLSSQFADWGAGFQDAALQDQVNRYNFYQNLPAQNLARYSGIIQGFGGLGGQQSSQFDPSSAQQFAGAAGGALTGAALGAKYGTAAGPWGTAIGAVGGGLLGYFSDRRLKTHIVRVGQLPSGLPLYRFRFRGSLAECLGVMSDEVRERFPHAVTRDISGFDRVDYRAIC